MLLPVTIDSTDCLLLTLQPDWTAALKGDFEVQTGRDAGLSNREGRRAFAAESILHFAYSATAEGDDAKALRRALRAYANEPLLVPFWRADCALADLAAARWTGGLRLFYEPAGGIWQVRAGATAPDSFVPSVECRTVPLLWARWDKLPDPDAKSGDVMPLTIDVVENGLAEYAIRPSGVVLASGPVVAGVAHRLLYPIPDWGSGFKAGGIDLRIARERIGYGRAEAEEYVAQAMRRTAKGTLICSGDDDAAVVELWRECAGNVGSWWAPLSFPETSLALASSASSAQISVVDASALVGEAYVALVTPGGDVAARRVVSIDTGANTITLDSAPGIFAADTGVYPLLLCRSTATSLSVKWTNPDLATIQIQAVELPTETILPAGETIGTTIGDLGAPCWLYVVTDRDLTWRYTSYESAIDAGALGTFEPRPIDHGDMTMELNLERHDLELTTSWWAGSPFWRAKTDRLAPRLTVQVYEGRVATPAAAELIFTGEFKPESYTGKKCTAKLAGMTSLGDVKGPIAVTSRRCWAPLFSAPCGLVENAVDAPAQLAGVAQGALFFEPSGGGGWPATVSDHYRYGYAERTLADGSKRRHRIVGSSPVDTSGAQSPLRNGLIEWWDFPETGRVPRYGSVQGTALTREDLAYVPHEIAPADRRRPLGCGAVRIDDGDSGNSLEGQVSIISAADAKANGITFALWIKTTSAYPNTLGLPIASANNCTLFQLAGGVMGLGGFDLPTNFGITPTNPDGWNLVVCVFGFARQPTSIYVSGASASTPATSNRDGFVYDYAPNVMNRGGVMGAWTGYLDQCILWNRCLSIEECDQLYNYGLGLTYADTATPGDQLVVRTLGALNPAPAALPESGWRLVPGCDKTYPRCKALGNGPNFRGFPNFPRTSPALTGIKQETASGGKK